MDSRSPRRPSLKPAWPPGIFRRLQAATRLSVGQAGAKLLRHFEEERLLTCKLIDVRDPNRSIGNQTRGVVRPDLAWESVLVEGREHADHMAVR